MRNQLREENSGCKELSAVSASKRYQNGRTVYTHSERPKKPSSLEVGPNCQNGHKHELKWRLSHTRLLDPKEIRIKPKGDIGPLCQEKKNLSSQTWGWCGFQCVCVLPGAGQSRMMITRSPKKCPTGGNAVVCLGLLWTSVGSCSPIILGFCAGGRVVWFGLWWACHSWRREVGQPWEWS